MRSVNSFIRQISRITNFGSLFYIWLTYWLPLVGQSKKWKYTNSLTPNSLRASWTKDGSNSTNNQPSPIPSTESLNQINSFFMPTLANHHSPATAGVTTGFYSGCVIGRGRHTSSSSGSARVRTCNKEQEYGLHWRKDFRDRSSRFKKRIKCSISYNGTSAKKIHHQLTSLQHQGDLRHPKTSALWVIHKCPPSHNRERFKGNSWSLLDSHENTKPNLILTVPHLIWGTI